MSVILIIHIVFASILTGAAIGLLILAIIKKSSRYLSVAARSSFGATIASGVGLVVISPQSLTHLCIMMTVYSLALFGVEALYRSRSKTSLLAQETTLQ